MNEPVRIAVLDDYQGVAESFADWGRLPGTTSLSVFHDTVTEHEALVERLRPLTSFARCVSARRFLRH